MKKAMPLLLFVLLCHSFICSACENGISKLYEKELSKGLKVSFWGVKFDDFKKIQKIKFKDGDSEVAFVPLDEASLYNIGYYEDIISPNKKYIVLPLGQFEGFCIFKTESLIKNMQTKKYYEIVKVFLKPTKEKGRDHPDLVHEFIGWEGDSTFKFSVGLSNHFEQCLFNIETRVFKVLGGDDIYDWVGLKGLRE